MPSGLAALSPLRFGRAMNDRGHSLLELVISLCLFVCLAAGLLRFLGACFGTLARAVERVELRRELRKAMDQLSDDIQQAGFRVPCLAAPEGPSLTLGPGGELSLVRDELLSMEGRLCAPLPNEDPVPLSRRVCLTANARVRMRKGDVLLLEDGALEGLQLEGPLDLQPREVGEVVVTAPIGEPPRAHEAGATVHFCRTLSRVIYRLEAASLVCRHDAGEVRVLVGHCAQFRVDLGTQPVVVVTLEARGRAGERCTGTLVRVSRNGLPP